MIEPRIVLGGLGPKLSGLTWESSSALRIGQQINLDVVLHDHSVERIHAEIRHQGVRWMLRDLAHNPFYPTLLNDVALDGNVKPLKLNDIVQIGKLQLRVTELVGATEPPVLNCTPRPAACAGQDVLPPIMTSGTHMLVKARTHQSWDKALELVTLDARSRPHQEHAMLALVRANHHVTHLAHLEDLLGSILSDRSEERRVGKECRL